MITHAFRGNRSRVFLVLIALSSLPAGWLLREALSGQTDPDPAVAEVPVTTCSETLSTFDAYPLVYLGDTFEGLPIKYCERQQTAGIAGFNPPTDSFYFIYGDCTIKPGRSSCNYPLQVIVYPRCFPPLVDTGARTEMVRGSPVNVLGIGRVLVITPQYRVKVSHGIEDAAGEALVSRALLQLRGANALARNLTVGKPLADPALVRAPAVDRDACEDADTLKSVAEPTADPTAGAPAP